MTEERKQRGRSVAITGAGNGLGRELAIGFSAKGYQVFGTALSESEKNLTTGGDITITIADITKEEQVNNWKEQVRKLLNGDGLNLLINNAGVLTPGPMEVLSLSARAVGIITSMLEQPNSELIDRYGVKALVQFTQANRQLLTKLAEWVDQNNIKVNIDKTFSIDEAADALDYQRDLHPRGKVILTV